MIFRKSVLFAAAATAVSATTLGTGAVATAEAAPAQGWMQSGEISYVGNTAWCQGNLGFAVEVDPHSPGTATVVLTPRGAHSSAPEWAQDPVCRAMLNIRLTDAVAPFSHDIQVPVALGQEPGEPVRHELRTSSGLVSIQVAANALDLQGRPQSQASVSSGGGWFIVP